MFYTVLANIPFWTASSAFGFFHHGVFCLEYAGIGVLALFAPRIVTVVLLPTVIAADLICGACRTYCLSVSECLANIGVFHALSGPRRRFAVAVVLLTALVTAVAAFLPAPSTRDRHRWLAAVCLVAFGALLLSADSVSIIRRTGHLPDFLGSGPRVDRVEFSLFNAARLARIPSAHLMKAELEFARIRKSEEATRASVLTVPGAAAVAVRFAGSTAGKGLQEKPNLVIVLVESWGLATDSTWKNALVQLYFEPGLQSRYEVMQGTVPFYGGTVAGEARDLCGNGLGFHLLAASTAELRGCLPQRLAAQGYHNIAVHGMDGHMFARSTWYARIGFQERWFNYQLKRQGLPDCPGAFVGTCDAAVAEWIGGWLAEHDADPYFVHWVTLNFHLPVLVPSPLVDGTPCSTALNLSPGSPLCSWYQLVANVHRSVSKLAMGKLGCPTIFVIVGDHVPPFGDPDLRNRFSDRVVPYVVLAPRPDNHPPNWLVAHYALAQVRAADKASSSTRGGTRENAPASTSSRLHCQALSPHSVRLNRIAY